MLNTRPAMAIVSRISEEVLHQIGLILLHLKQFGDKNG